MKDPPGYLLPAGDAYTDDLACTLVFYPDKPEYRRALLGSIVYLSNWLAWERDSEKRGKDAARAWKNAVDETLECWTMACFEELMADVARIRDLLETKKDCCDDNVVYYPTEEPTTGIEPQIGDPPEYYGETAISDWDEWVQHVCYNAHGYVDFLVSTAGQLYNAVEVSSIFVGVIAAALALLAFSGIGLPIAFGLAAFVVSGIALSATILTFANTADDLEAAREDIVCAIVTGQPLPDAVETALGSGADWDLFYQWVSYGEAIAIIYEGGYGSEFLPEQTRDDCDVCEFEPLLNGFELWGERATMNIVWSPTPPACLNSDNGCFEDYITLDDCAVSHTGKLRFAGYVTIAGTMYENTNCIGILEIYSTIQVTGSLGCRQHRMIGPATAIYLDESVTPGVVDLHIPFDFVAPQDLDNIKTLSIGLRVDLRSGDVDLDCALFLQLIEDAE